MRRGTRQMRRRLLRRPVTAYDWLIMTHERWRQIEELYHSARERGVGVLADTDPELRREVERLLAQDSDGKFLDRPAVELLAEFTVTQGAPGGAPGFAGQTVYQ